MKIRDIMTDSAITVPPDASIYEAARVMQQHNIGSVPVVCDQKGLMGIITDRDIIVRNVARELDPKTHKVHEVMTKNVETVTPDTDVHEASKLMAEDKIRRLPVIENDNVIGMVSLGDLAINNDFRTEAAKALCDISQGCHKKHPTANN